ncbi:uncharacterized protein LOC141614030 [Silene latifolia]|uniref:uncharacterized protein LOC141614030 n=1 Tax=Silene latifolia TaxID=37657 RepID=UPI003D774C0F
MIISSWNIRGLNDPLKHHEVGNFLVRNKVDVFGLLETHVKEKNTATIFNKFSRYHILTNYQSHPNGRIWFFLNPRTTTLHSSVITMQSIHCTVVHNATNQKLDITMVYGCNSAKDREQLWQHLVHLSSCTDKWILMGDFNIVRDFSERLGPNPPRLSEILQFNDCLETSFPSSSVHVMLPGISDHSPLLVKVFEDTPCHRMFSFLNCWTTHSQFLPTVKNSWSVSVKGSAMFKIFRKLYLLRNGLRSLHQEGFSQLPARVKQAWVDWQDCQQLLQTAPSDNALMAQETTLMATYKTLKAAELSMLQQREKIQGINKNDCSSSYFFARITQRRQQSIVGHITDHNGNVVQGVADVNAAFVNYYKELLGEKQEVQPLDREFIASGACLPEANHASLCTAVTNKEIKDALFSIDSTKSPGHDGYSHWVFKSTWQSSWGGFYGSLLGATSDRKAPQAS